MSESPHPDEHPRVVLDTNLLVAAAYAPHSASRRWCERAAAGAATLLVGPAVFREYRFVVPRAVRRPGGVAAVLGWLRHAEAVFPTARDEAAARGVSEDPDDDMFLALAAAGRADLLLSNDRHLLDVGEYRGVPVRRPSCGEGRLFQAVLAT